MKKVLFLILATFLILGACGQEESKSENNEETKSSSKEDKKKDENKKSNNDEKDVVTKDDESQTENNSSQQVNKEQRKETPENNQQDIDINNIADRGILKSVIYGNSYSEGEKIQAYNSAVTNGVIPQGNVMEGPASAAYESSLKVESGEEESIYNKSENNKNQDLNENDSDYDNPYMNLPNQEWRANTGDGLSSGEKQTKQQILDGTYEGDDGDQILEALDYYQSKYGN